MKKTENVLGFGLIALSLILGKMFLATDMLFFRLVIGMSLGYTLSRAYTGFAGSVNRAFNTGSTRLMKTLVFMFFITSVLVAGFLYTSGMGAEMEFNLWINPISLGLLVGGVMFGFGMALSACCASGVLTDLVTALPRGLITLITFGFGIFIGFPLAATDFANKSFISSEVGELIGRNGVFFPDLFKWDGLNGYLGAIILTGILCSLVVWASNVYESKRKKEGTYTSHFAENMQDQTAVTTDTDNYVLNSETTYKKLFVNPWSLKMGAVALAIIFALLMGVTKAGWGASTPYGLWFGKVLMLFGISPESLANYSKVMSAGAFSTPFFEHAISVQNFGILVGTTIYLLTAGKLSRTFTSELNISLSEGLLYALGGLAMGVGTRLSKGCNVGALYTPIAQFSLSGWIFLVVMIIGGVLGNMFAKKVLK